MPFGIGLARVKRTVELLVRRSDSRGVSFGVRDLGDLKAVVQFEDRRGEIFECGKGDFGRCGETVAWPGRGRRR